MEAVELAAGSGATASDTILDERHGMRLAPQVQGWCSWCCQWHYHQLVEECLLTRDVYKCQGCLRRTLACRRACGAFARGFDVWDEERCAACEGRVRHGGYSHLPEICHSLHFRCVLGLRAASSPDCTRKGTVLGASRTAFILITFCPCLDLSCTSAAHAATSPSAAFAALTLRKLNLVTLARFVPSAVAMLCNGQRSSRPPGVFARCTAQSASRCRFTSRARRFPKVQTRRCLFAAAAAGVDWFSVPGMGVSMVNAKGANSWPVSTASFILMYKEPADKAAAAEALKFFDWAFKNGKAMAAELDYVPLPDALTDAIRSKVWSQIKR